MSLFELRSGRYFLTEAGEALHHYACKIDALMKEARRVTQEFKDFHKGAITIGASYVPATYLLPEVVHQFQCEFPNIKITLLVKTAPEIRMMLQNHEIDLGIISAAPFDEPLFKTNEYNARYTCSCLFQRTSFFKERQCIVTKYRKGTHTIAS